MKATILAEAGQIIHMLYYFLLRVLLINIIVFLFSDKIKAAAAEQLAKLEAQAAEVICYLLKFVIINFSFVCF